MSTPEIGGPPPEQPKGSKIKEFISKLIPFRRGRSTQRRNMEAPQTPTPGGSDWDLPDFKPQSAKPEPPQPPPEEKKTRWLPRPKETTPPEPKAPDFDRRFSQEAKYLSEKYGGPDLKILPKDEWAIHYQNGAEAQNNAIGGLLQGSTTSSAAVSDLTPDALLYDASELESQGLPAVEARVMDAATGIRTYDYQRFAEFTSSMQGTHMNQQNAERIYGTIAADRSREIMLTSYDASHQHRVVSTMDRMVGEVESMTPHLNGMDQILSAARLQYFNEHQRIHTSGATPGNMIASENVPFYENIHGAYRDYVVRGDNDAYRHLVDVIHEYFREDRTTKDQTPPTPPPDDSKDRQDQQQDPPQNEEMSEPPRASDEYSQPTESPRGGPEFVITPPHKDYYVRERHTHYDRATKTWSHTKNLSSYTKTSNAADKKTIAGEVKGNINTLLELPIPPEHIVDAGSVESSGQRPEIFQDETGTFYFKKADAGKYHVDFVKEDSAVIPPTPDESLSMYQGPLSDATETFLSSLSGSAIEKVGAIQQFLSQQHTYPDNPGEIQNGIRNGSTGDNYIQNLDNSPELECYSTATLYAALSRHENIPTRVVIGDLITEAKGGKAVIDSTTKHAWNEVWVGSKWITIDATPSKAGEQGDSGDQKDPGDSGDKSQQGEPGNQQGDGEQSEGQGEPGEQSSEQSESGEQSGQQGQLGDGSSQSGEPGTQESSGQSSNQQMPGNDLVPNQSASDTDINQGEANIDQADEAINQAQQRQEDLRQQMDDASSFEDMQRLQDELERSEELFKDMKEELEKKAKAKEEQMKKKLEDELKKMERDGFLNPDRRKELKKQLEEGEISSNDLDRLKATVEKSPDYLEFKTLRDEARPFVGEALRRLAPLLPTVETIQTDTERTSRYGEFDPSLVSDTESYITGRVMRPRTARPETRPFILADLMIDVSLSMREGKKLPDAKFLLVFFNELFKEIHKKYGYIHYSISSFADDIMPIKTPNQDPTDPKPYTYPDGSKSTVNAKIIQGMRLRSGTDILQAVNASSQNLNTLSRQYPNYFSGLYFVGDGQDMHGHDPQIVNFMNTTDSQNGFGRHRRSATMLGGPSQRDVLAKLFGDKNTAVAPDRQSLINAWISQFGRDVKQYMTRMGY